MKRRDFLKLIGIGTLVAGCEGHLNKYYYLRKDKYIPYVVRPENIPNPDAGGGDEFLYMPTTCVGCPAGCGALAAVRDKVFDGKHGIYATKLEGIPNHPINDSPLEEPFNVGALCIRGQASLFNLYSPFRIRTPYEKTANGQFREIDWESALKKIEEKVKESKREGLKNVYLAGRTTGSLDKLIEEFCSSLGFEKWPYFEPLSHSTLREGINIVFGTKDIPVFRIENSDFLITFGADITETFVSPVSYMAGFSRARKNPSFRWVHFEPHLSATGLSADKRIVIKPGSEPYLLSYFIRWLYRENSYKNPIPGELVDSLPKLSLEEVSKRTGVDAEYIDRILRWLSTAKSPLIIYGGVSASHKYGLEGVVLTAILWHMLGMVGKTLDFKNPENYEGVGSVKDLIRLKELLNKGEVGVIFISRTNPCYYLEGFSESLNNARLVVGLNYIKNENAKVLYNVYGFKPKLVSDDTPEWSETLQSCDLILALNHPYEEWGDEEPRKGLLSLRQPIARVFEPPENDDSNNHPMFNTRSEGDILLALMGRKESYKEYLHKNWEEKVGKEGIKKLLEKGYLLYSSKTQPSFNAERTLSFVNNMGIPEAMETPILMVIPSHRWYDGRERSNVLLNEIPDNLTTITYGEWVNMSKETAKKYRIKDIPPRFQAKEEVEISKGEFSKKILANVQPFMPEDIITIHLGMVSTKYLEVEQRTGEFITYIENVDVKRTKRFVSVPIMAGSYSQKGRGIVPEKHHKKFHYKYAKFPLSQMPYPDHSWVHKEYLWGYAVDEDLCTGCGACVAACYIENNCSLSGRDEHLKGREMSWLRVEPYYEEEANFVLMPCQQCENAPCEPVCPVRATYHNDEGLNVQVLNRCVGTRFCSNNCPYKVRRFNWLDYKWVEPLDRILNPDLSVRGKGVMEKCTFCYHRIRRARINATLEGRKIREGEVLPACAQTCPTGAIVFGNLLEGTSRVSKIANSKHSFRVLEELGTEPKVWHLPKERREV